MEEKNKEPKLGEGLIPKLIRKWAYQKRFTKEQKEELQKIKTEAYMTSSHTLKGGVSNEAKLTKQTTW